MLLPSNAFALLLNSATSIWSSVTLVGLVLRGDLRQRVAAPARRGRRRRRRGGGARSRCARPARADCGRGRRSSQRRHARGATGSTADRRRGDTGRIEQERVFADDAAGRPVRLDHQIEIRLVRPACGDVTRRYGTAVGRALDGDAGAGEDALVGEVVLAVQRRIGDLRRAASRAPPWRRSSSICADERLAERGRHRQPAERQRVGAGPGSASALATKRQRKMGFARMPTP